MADHHENTGPLEVGAAMDYSEHEKTFNGFVALT
ncbi:MAG: aa3-type cytochrome c oxidase subunit IV, partial [Rhizobiaceae bacterium]